MGGAMFMLVGCSCSGLERYGGSRRVLRGRIGRMRRVVKEVWLMVKVEGERAREG